MSKSRNEKKPPTQAPPTLTTNDIIPGKFNDNQWSFMVDQEGGQDFVVDIVDEIVDCTIKVIYDKYIQSQLQPYSVEAAKDLLLQIIESRFLAHDSGEEILENDATWLEDEEPIPCVTDSWSQGSVPFQQCLSRPLSARSDSRSCTEPDVETDHHPFRDAELLDVSDGEHEKPEVMESEIGENSTQQPDISLSPEFHPSPPATARGSSPGRRRKPGVKPTGKRRSEISRKKRVSNDSTSLEDKKIVAGDLDATQLTDANPVKKQQQGRAPCAPEVAYDDHGNIVGMIRLNTDKFPTHRIRTRFNIIDPLMDSMVLSSQQSRRATVRDRCLNQLRDGQNSQIIRPKKLHDKQALNGSSINLNYSLEVTDNSDKEIVKPLPPPLADSMNISAGVVIREGEIVRKGPEMYPSVTMSHKIKQDSLSLQPVGSLSKKQTISVTDVIGTTSPVIRQMRVPDPIPPITPYQHS